MEIVGAGNRLLALSEPYQLVCKPSVEHVLTSLAIALALNATAHIKISPPNEIRRLEEREAVFVGFKVPGSTSITNTGISINGREYYLGLSSVASKALKLISSIRRPDKRILALLSIAHVHFREEVCGLDCGEDRLTTEFEHVRTLLIPIVPNSPIYEWPKYSATPLIPLHDEVRLRTHSLQEVLLRLGEHLYSRGFHTALLDRLIAEVPAVIENPGLYLNLWEAAIFYEDFRIVEGSLDKVREYVRALNEEVKYAMSKAFSEGRATVFKVNNVKLVDKVSNILRYYMRARDVLVVLHEGGTSYARLTTPYHSRRKLPNISQLAEKVKGVEYVDVNDLWAEVCVNGDRTSELIAFLSKL